MGKWNSPNLSDTLGFECLRHSNWTICNLLKTDFVPTNFLPFFAMRPEAENLAWPLSLLSKTTANTNSKATSRRGDKSSETLMRERKRTARTRTK